VISDLFLAILMEHAHAENTKHFHLANVALLPPHVTVVSPPATPAQLAAVAPTTSKANSKALLADRRAIEATPHPSRHDELPQSRPRGSPSAQHRDQDSGAQAWVRGCRTGQDQVELGFAASGTFRMAQAWA
jgi:hypothetical protein